MVKFCRDEFYVLELIWNEKVPLISDCFEQTVFTYLPAVYIIIFGLYDLFKSKNTASRPGPWTILNISKIFFSTLLVMLNFSKLFITFAESDSDKFMGYSHIVAAITEIVSLTIALRLIFCHKKNNVHTSGVLFLFWLIYITLDSISFILIILKTYTASNDFLPVNTFDFVYKSLHIAFTASCFLLTCWSDYKLKSKQSCPRNSASFLSKLIFWWYRSLISLGFKKTLTENDLWNLNDELQSKNAYNQFFKEYDKEVKKFKRAKTEALKKRSLLSEESDEDQSKIKDINILIPFFKTYKYELVYAASFKFFSVMAGFAQPFLLDAILGFIRFKDDQVLWKGYFFTVCLLLSSVLESILNNQYEYSINMTSLKLKAALTTVIYSKSLVLSSIGRKDFTIGELVNLMSIDVQRIVDFVTYVNWIWSNFLQIAISIALIWRQLGLATIPGVFVMVLMILPNAFITIKFKKLQQIRMTNKDKRSKILSESLNSIKVLKVYAWIEAFIKRIKFFRKKEVESLRKMMIYLAAMAFVFNLTPFLVSLVSFSSYVFIYTGFEDQLDANRMFVSLSLFNLIRIPLGQLPWIVSNGSMCFVSIKYRINKYLSADELEDAERNKSNDQNYPVRLENAFFSWNGDLNKNKCILKDINFKVKKGTLVAICGPIGSGKSSLFSAILGEMKKVDGNVALSDSVAYVNQTAWILNETVKNNILFGERYDKEKYEKIIDKTKLREDLDTLDAGDETEIGEKGINLSGGQKQRVSIARACYSNKSIYLFDDPLSALDMHVGTEVFNNIISNEGLLKNKTRLLITHRLSVLKKVDYIIVIKDGEISEQGTYKELIDKKQSFSDLMSQYLNETHKDLEDNSKRQSTEIKSKSLIKFENDKKSLEKQSEPKNKGKLIEKERMEVGKVNRKVYWKYLKAMNISMYLLAILGYVFSHGFNFVSQLWLSAWSNDANNANNFNNTDLRNKRLIGYAGFGAAEMIFIFLSAFIISLSCLNASKKLFNLMLLNVFEAPMSWFESTPQGRIMNRFVKDSDTTDFGLHESFRGVVLYLFRVLVPFAIISMQTYWFIVALIPIIFIYILIQKFYISLSRQLKRLESTTRSPIYSHFQETVLGTSSIRAHQVENRFIEECCKRIDKNHRISYPNICAVRWLSIRLEFLGNLIVFFSAFFAIVYRDSLTAGLVGISITSAFTIIKNLDVLIKAFSDLEMNIVSVERCLEYTRIPSEKFAEVPENKPTGDWPSKGEIKFENYSTKYRSDLDLVLKDLNFEIDSGQKIGVVGRTGAGKSTISLSLFRIIESTNGKIIIDGVDISKIGLNDLRSKLSIIPQDPILFSGTIRFNLDPYEKHSDEELWKALEQAHLKQFISDQKGGLDHLIAESGENLSLGQRQLVCLARALLRKSKILVLDEATASVDIETDELIQKTIRSQFDDCSFIVIAHRINSILDYDKILVLENGRIKEFDTPANLLANKNSIFYSMAKDAGLVA